MDYTNEMLARLQEGETIEDLAKELTKAINDANSIYQKEQKAKSQNSEKIAAVNDLLGALTGIVEAWDLGDELYDALGEEDPEEWVDMIDELLPVVQKYMEVMNAIKSLREDPCRCQAGGCEKEDPIEDFLNKFVR